MIRTDSIPSDIVRQGVRSAAAPCAAAAYLLLVIAAGCAGPAPAPKLDPEYARLDGSAHEVFEAGQVERAARLYERALQRARAMDDAAAAGDAAYNLAACYLVLGDGEKAAAYIGEAKAELQRSGRSPAEALLLEAEAAALGGRGSDAAELCRGILSLDDASEEPRHRAQALLLLARIARDGKDLSGARRLLSEAEEPLDDADDLSLFARAAGLEAAILLLEESPAAAAEALDREAALLRDAGRYREMAAALARAGDAYLEAGDPAAAAERLYRSARSLLGQGHEAAARQRAGTALTAARAAGDEDLEKRILLLLQD